MSPILYQYTGNYQIFTAPGTGLYKIECWGAQGCSANSGRVNSFGGYVSGIIRLRKNEELYIYCGDGGRNNTITSRWNGGGNGAGINEYNWSMVGAGGGATDIRLISGTWDNVLSLRSRIIVAGAGGGGCFDNSPRPYDDNAKGGGLEGYPGGYVTAGSPPSQRVMGGTQTAGGLGDNAGYHSGRQGDFGIGANAQQGTPPSGYYIGGGGGSGYYGGGSGGTQNNWIGCGGGGSSFISGHTGCDAVNSSGTHTGQPNHYSEKIFQDSQMIDGAGYQWTSVKGSLLLMPKPLGGNYASGVGHSGSGFCKISKAL